MSEVLAGLQASAIVPLDCAGVVLQIRPNGFNAIETQYHFAGSDFTPTTFTVKYRSAATSKKLPFQLPFALGCSG